MVIIVGGRAGIWIFLFSLAVIFFSSIVPFITDILDFDEDEQTRFRPKSTILTKFHHDQQEDATRVFSNYEKCYFFDNFTHYFVTLVDYPKFFEESPSTTINTYITIKDNTKRVRIWDLYHTKIIKGKITKYCFHTPSNQLFFTWYSLFRNNNVEYHITSLIIPNEGENLIDFPKLTSYNEISSLKYHDFDTFGCIYFSKTIDVFEYRKFCYTVSNKNEIEEISFTNSVILRNNSNLNFLLGIFPHQSNTKQNTLTVIKLTGNEKSSIVHLSIQKMIDFELESKENEEQENSTNIDTPSKSKMSSTKPLQFELSSYYYNVEKEISSSNTQVVFSFEFGKFAIWNAQINTFKTYNMEDIIEPYYFDTDHHRYYDLWNDFIVKSRTNKRSKMYISQDNDYLFLHISDAKSGSKNKIFVVNNKIDPKNLDGDKKIVGVIDIVRSGGSTNKFSSLDFFSGVDRVKRNKRLKSTKILSFYSSVTSGGQRKMYVLQNDLKIHVYNIGKPFKKEEKREKREEYVEKKEEEEEGWWMEIGMIKSLVGVYERIKKQRFMIILFLGVVVVLIYNELQRRGLHNNNDQNIFNVDINNNVNPPPQNVNNNNLGNANNNNNNRPHQE